MIKHLLALGAAVSFSTFAMAQVTVTDPWARATVPAQKTGGAFMTVQSARAARLVGASTPAAGSVEMHKMEMQGQTMKMGAVDAIVLPAGQPVALSTNYHLMLLDLKQPLKEGDTIALTLVIEDAAKKRESVTVKVPVKPLAYSPPRAPAP